MSTTSLLDEVPEVVQSVVLKIKDLYQEFYINGGYIEVEDTGLVLPTDKWRQNREDVADTLSSRS